MKIKVWGNGFVSDHLPYERIKERIPLSERGILSILDKEDVDVVINCIGATGKPNVDWCEDHREETIEKNVTLPLLLAGSCYKKGIKMIHIGSGCIFFGYKEWGWLESDFANPESFYSKTKYSCDLSIGGLDNVCILRIRMPVSSQNVERNFISKIAKYDKIINMPNSMTFMDDFVRCVDFMAKGNYSGIYHLTNPEPLTAVDVMNEYSKYKKTNYKIISNDELDLMVKAKRSNCILNTKKLESIFDMENSKVALEKCMKKYFGAE